RRAAHGDRIEVGYFQRNVGGGGADAVVQAAHHARQPDGNRLAIGAGRGDEQVGRVELQHLFREELQLLALPGAPYLDDATTELGQVVGVRRLTEFERHEVGDVDEVVARAQAHSG